MRLIDADRLKLSFEANTPIAFQDCVPGIHSVIDCAPTIDAVPVRHGKWIKGTNHGLGVYTLACNKCGYCVVSSSGTNFCPYCGVKMDERKEE